MPKRKTTKRAQETANKGNPQNQNQGGSGMENITGALAQLLERILDKGLVVHGKITINKLILTSTDKGKEMGLIPDYHEMKEEGE